MHAREVDAGDRRTHRLRARGQREGVVRLRVLGAVIDAAHGHGLRRAIDRDDLLPDPHVEVERLAQALGRLHEQAAAIGDHPADEVGQAAVGERDVVAALEHDDLGELVETTGAGGEGCSSGDSADNDKLHSSLLDGGHRSR